MFAFQQCEEGRVFDPAISECVSRQEAAQRYLCDGAIEEHESRIKHYSDEEPAYERLSEQLLDKGGIAVLIKHEPKLHILLDKGSFYTGSVRQLDRDELTHEAIKTLYNEGTIEEIGIGWALRADNGVWTRHIWACEDESVLEPTATERSAYFGVTYDEVGAETSGLFRVKDDPTPLSGD